MVSLLPPIPSRSLDTVLTLYCTTGKHVVFGEVVSGLDVMKAIEKEGSDSGKPKSKIDVAACGVVA